MKVDNFLTQAEFAYRAFAGDLTRLENQIARLRAIGCVVEWPMFGHDCLSIEVPSDKVEEARAIFEETDDGTSR